MLEEMDARSGVNLPRFYFSRAEQALYRRASHMTMITSIQDSGRDPSVTAAEQLFEEAIQKIGNICKSLDKRDLDVLPELKTAVPDAVAATKLLLQEKHRVYELHKKKSGIVHDYAIDFDAARDEIRSRLACLRNAGEG